MDKIRINNMKFWTYNGVLIEEQKLGQQLEIDLEMRLDLSVSGKEDDLTKTVNYAKVHQIITELVSHEQFKLIEALASCILDEMGKYFSDRLCGALIRIRKKYVPMAGIFDDIEIEMERKF
ncbi:MAG: dihydroneopterin aldolase [Lactobacillales bacterium]|jgi:dihydroneopterin aldolase|nr:dihydroneopterin aldolase [Lactobacillales bacterium]